MVKGSWLGVARSLRALAVGSARDDDSLRTVGIRMRISSVLKSPKLVALLVPLVAFEAL